MEEDIWGDVNAGCGGGGGEFGVVLCTEDSLNSADVNTRWHAE